jgi:VanZ family protein
MARRGSVIVPWLLVGLWVSVIWGQSLLAGADSSSESEWFMDLVRRGAAWLYSSDIPVITRFLDAHPGILATLADTDRLHFLIRKGAHFSEYFVLGLLVLNAVRRTLRSIASMALTLCMIWATVPGIDETIQRFVPGRAGMLRDVFIDMSGFGSAVALCLPFLLIGSILSGPKR